jgi:dihydrofolate reductase
MHVSLDGFVTDPNGGMRWVHVDDEIFEYAGRRTSEADTALYGRVTWQMMDAYWPTAPDQPNASKHDIEHGTWYNNVEKVVLSRSMQGQKLPKTTIISDNLEKEVNKIKQREGGEIIIFGSPSAAHSLMQYGLIDEFWLFINPIVVGGGIPLFKDVKESFKLKLVASTAFTSGVVCMHYEKL